MFDFNVLALLAQPESWLTLLVGVLAGLAVGVLPGLGTVTALALLTPFVFNMDPAQAIIFLASLTAVTMTGGSITSILMGIPGESVNAATILDGYPMMKNGEAGRAVGAAIMSSILGGIFGAIVLAAIIPVVKPAILSLGHPELTMLAVFGLTLIAYIGKEALGKGLIMTAFGVALSLVGHDPITGSLRYTFGSETLYDGIPLVPVLLGLFAIPELVDAYGKGRDGGPSKAGVPRITMSQAYAGQWLGVKDTFQHWFLVIRCGAIGTFLGMVPGVGASVSTFIAYGHAKQSAKDPSRFGRGAVEGVLAPEAANNAKDGGALVPTLGLGIPGSAVMVLLMASFTLIGVPVGPELLKSGQGVILGIAVLVAVANVVGGAIAYSGSAFAIKLTSVDPLLMVPWIAAFVVLGAFGPQLKIFDLVVTFAFGGLGIILQRYGYPVVGLVLGLVLGPILNINLEASLSYFGWAGMFMRPLTIVMTLLCIFVIARSVYSSLKKNDRPVPSEVAS
jgi:putative tricarboxylic transport membrane protein